MKEVNVSVPPAVAQDQVTAPSTSASSELSMGLGKGIE
jgi:hypothetical protein